MTTPDEVQFRESRRLALPTKLRLVAMTLSAYGRTRRALGRNSDPRAALAELRGPKPLPEDAGTYLPALRITRAVALVLRALPADSRCLSTSVVACAVLARFGIGSSVVIGVKAEDAFGAHAWVELDGRPLLPPTEDRFDRLVTL